MGTCSLGSFQRGEGMSQWEGGVASRKPATSMYQVPWMPFTISFCFIFNLILHVRIQKFEEVKLSAFANVTLEDSKPDLYDCTCYDGHGYAWAASTVAHLCSSLFSGQSYWELCVLVQLTLHPSTRKSLLKGSWSFGLWLLQHQTKIKIQPQKLKGQLSCSRYYWKDLSSF